MKQKEIRRRAGGIVLRMRHNGMRIFYYGLGAVGLVVFGAVVWTVAERFPLSISPVSVLQGAIILVALGLMVSFLIGKRTK